MGIWLEHENYATGVSMREMSTQVGSKGNNRGAEGLPEVQEPVLEHAAPEARQNQGLTSRLADGDYPENDDAVKLAARKRLNHGHFIVRNLGTPQEVWAVPTVLLFPSDQAPAQPS
jgi:hypothetical protein